MRHILSFFAAAISLFVTTACSKGHTGPSGTSGLMGRWRELSATGGLAGTTTRYDGELRILQLNEDST
ncbi:MAG TPA: hypothetical protein VIM64_04830, partial [Puia sp.]